MAAPAGQQGDFGRNVLRGFGAFQGDFAVQREFGITEQLHLDFRSEFFEILYHPNFRPPDSNIADTFFGYLAQTLTSSLSGPDRRAALDPVRSEIEVLERWREHGRGAESM
jgi:hypothetical protein